MAANYVSKSRLSHSRYESDRPKANYYTKASDLLSSSSKSFMPQDEALRALLTDFRNLFNQTQEEKNYLYDVVIDVEPDPHRNEGRSSPRRLKVYAQKQMLMARSAYFEKVVFPEPKSEQPINENEFKYDPDPITGVHNVTFKPSFCSDVSLLREAVGYMYWGFWEHKSFERSRDMFELAAKLDLKELRKMCAEELVKGLTPKTVMEILILADEYDPKFLKNECIKYIILHKSEMNQKEFEEKLLKDKYAHLVADLYRDEVFIEKSRRGGSSI
jgi:hypothetical protein